MKDQDNAVNISGLDASRDTTSLFGKKKDLAQDQTLESEYYIQGGGGEDLNTVAE
jgi:hypothetical protein